MKFLGFSNRTNPSLMLQSSAKFLHYGEFREHCCHQCAEARTVAKGHFHPCYKSKPTAISGTKSPCRTWPDKVRG